MIDFLFTVFGVVISIYMIIVILSYAYMLLAAYLEVRQRVGLDKKDEDTDYKGMYFAKPVSVIVPAYNESSGILNSVHSLLNLNYPEYEVVVVNDGSTDDTQEKLINEFELQPIFQARRIQIKSKPVTQVFQSKLHPNLYLIEKENGGKADALNAGINLAHYPYICSVDGDSILHKYALLRVMEPMVASDGEVIAAGGTIRVANEMDVELGSLVEAELYNQPLVLMQAVEYIRSFLIGRIALSRHNLLLIISGAFSVFDRQWVIDVGGYSVDMIGEDMELVVKLHRLNQQRKANKKIIAIPDPICYTEAPQSTTILRRQRRRWHQGLLASLMRHKDMLFNYKYGKIGMISLPYYWFVEAAGPVIELLGLLYIILSFFFGKIYFEFMLTLSILFIIYSSFYSLGAIQLDNALSGKYLGVRALFRLVIISLTDLFWFRPLSVYWRLEGIYRTIKGNTDWGVMERAGFGKKEK